MNTYTKRTKINTKQKRTLLTYYQKNKGRTNANNEIKHAQ